MRGWIALFAGAATAVSACGDEVSRPPAGSGLVDPGGGSSSGGASSGSSSGSPSSGSDGGGTASEARSGGSLVFRDDFESGADCGDWAPAGAASPPVSTTGGRNGGRACRHCVQAGGSIAKSVAGAGAGTYAVEVHVENEDLTASDVELAVILKDQGGATLGVGAKSVPPSSSAFGAVQVVATSAQDPASVYVTFGSYDGKGCVLVDDATLTRTAP